MSFTYKTVSKEFSIQLKEKGSRFISFLFPIQSEEVFKRRLHELKNEFPDATHHCYAFRLAKSGNHARSSDDGEPSGTAGKPIMNQLLSADLAYCAIVVIRYFGGTKLGTPGLIKAYKESAKAVIESAKIVMCELTVNCFLTHSFSLSGEISRILNQHQAEVLKKEADEKLHLHVSVPLKNLTTLKQKLNSLNGVKFICDQDQGA